MQLQTIVITGASSGIGAALCRLYAVPGRKLVLVGRHAERLAATAGDCRSRGAEVESGLIDIRDRARISDFLTALDRKSPIDLLIANAGILAGTSPSGVPENLEQAIDVFAVNVLGAMHTVLPVLPAMQERGRGQIAFMSSLSAFAPLPDAPAYSASKAALLAYGLALREQTKKYGIRVNVACPGYVRTPMSSRQQGWLPFELGAEVAARQIVRGLQRDVAVITFPSLLSWLARASSLVPERLRSFGLRQLRMTVVDDQ